MTVRPAISSWLGKIAGKGAKIELLQGMPITGAMLFEEEPTRPDLRHREMKSVYLPSDLRKRMSLMLECSFQPDRITSFYPKRSTGSKSGILDNVKRTGDPIALQCIG